MLIIVHPIQDGFQLEIVVVGQINQKYYTRLSSRDLNSAVPGSKRFPIRQLHTKTFKSLPGDKPDPVKAPMIKLADVEYKVKENTAEVSMNVPSVLNALSKIMFRVLSLAVKNAGSV